MQSLLAFYTLATAAITPAIKWFSYLSLKPVEYNNMEAAIYSKTDRYVPNERWVIIGGRLTRAGVDLSYRVRQSVETVQKQSAELLQLLNKHYDEVDVVKVAFQWAESPHEVFLAVKFSNRWSSPGALVVSDESLEVKGNKLKYVSMGTQSDKKKKYILELELYDEVIKDETRVSPVSMGRFTITLKKARPSVWNTLTKGNEKIPNQQIWWDMKDKHQIACDTFVEEKPEEKSEL
ncbi:hypothetical protein, conserved [Babesia bigemina]|uniref:CS domain-containing protein n=1 Tax=Babesia bigemina TaxID=5866 RepID=A0A061DD25_BABBI|nr:hypothetical protein, conserved [Babesia bigemina]CDR97044.1 hypothetical protein, conserved [Babesia bigemina]|eukprot:XP_012769230.1 hypothetical protein, conserved [Babesia bigemina]